MKNLPHQDKLEIIRQLSKEYGFRPVEVANGAKIAPVVAATILDSKMTEFDEEELNRVLDYIDDRLTIKPGSCDEIMKALRQSITIKEDVIERIKKQARFCAGCPKLHEHIER